MSPLETPVKLDLTDADIARFWSKVKSKELNQCWEWTDPACPWGYGRFAFKRTKIMAHRAVCDRLRWHTRKEQP